MRASDPAVTWLGERLPQMEAALRPLVEQNSFTDHKPGGDAVGAGLRELFKLDGMSCEAVPSKRYADHLVFRSEGDASKAPVAMIGHHDTVFPPGKFEGYREDGALRRGPGVLDMKGGLVVIAFALKALAETRGLSSLPPLRIVVVGDEEVGSPEGADVIRRAVAGSQAALVFESGRANDAIITRRKGTGGITVRATGKAAHAGNAHQEGANAIWALCRFIDRAQALTDYERGITVNVGKISGGQGKNTVPDAAEALADVRFITSQDGEALVERLRQVASEAAASVPGTTVELLGGVARMPLERTEASAALMERYAACARACGLQASEAALVGGGSDASTSSALGIPSIDGLGPRGKGFHTVDEYIEVDTLVPKAQALALCLAGF